jgi:hypothetical protein
MIIRCKKCNIGYTIDSEIYENALHNRIFYACDECNGLLGEAGKNEIKELRKIQHKGEVTTLTEQMLKIALLIIDNLRAEKQTQLEPSLYEDGYMDGIGDVEKELKKFIQISKENSK